MASHLQQIRIRLGLNQSDLAKILKCSKSNISAIEIGRTPLTEGYKALLVQNLYLNYLWFDNQDEPMFADECKTPADSAEAQTSPAGVPMYNVHTLPALTNLLLRRVRRPRPLGHISIPGMPRCDGAVHITGDGMYPLLRSGDIVMYSLLDSPSEIFWGEMYLVSVATSAGEYVAVRYLLKSPNEGRALMSGENPAFADTEIELSKIKALAMIKTSIRNHVSR